MGAGSWKLSEACDRPPRLLSIGPGPVYSISGSCPLSSHCLQGYESLPSKQSAGTDKPPGEERLPLPVIQLGTPAALRQLARAVVSQLHPAISPALSLWLGQLSPPALATCPSSASLHPVPEVGPPMLTASVAGSPTIRPANVPHRHSRSQARGRSLGLRGGGGQEVPLSPLQPESLPR